MPNTFLVCALSFPCQDSLPGIVWLQIDLEKLAMPRCRYAAKAFECPDKYTLPKTNIAPAKKAIPKRTFIFQPAIFRCYVGFREGHHSFSERFAKRCPTKVVERNQSKIYMRELTAIYWLLPKHWFGSQWISCPGKSKRDSLRKKWIDFTKISFPTPSWFHHPPGSWKGRLFTNWNAGFNSHTETAKRRNTSYKS